MGSILQMDEVSDWLMWNSSALTRGDRMGIGSSSETFEGLFAGSAVAIKRPMITVLPPDVHAHLISLASRARIVKSNNVCPILALSAQTMTGASHIFYLAPEIIRGEPTSTASDVYALGIITFLMLTGWETPYPQVPSQLVVAGMVLANKLTPDVSQAPAHWVHFLQLCFEPAPSRASLSRLEALLNNM